MAVVEIWEKRLLFSSTAGTLLAFLLQIIAVCTTHWLTFRIPGGLMDNTTGKPSVLLQVESGLWRICESGYKPAKIDGTGLKTSYEKCSSHNMFPSQETIKEDNSVSIKLLDYMRTGSAFGIICLLIMFLGHLFAIYTLKRPRYVLKRLTALMHFMTAACVLVENEVFIRQVDYSRRDLPERLPSEAEWKFGYSFVLSWISFGLYVIAGCIFLFMSHKKKQGFGETGDKLAEEDEPVAIRR
ncbi:hypothetical protein FSP39_000489 [Pinctada imbricata]|uniref:Uncharacterized protein n=1 Tax=Pinctada imbricata TaxID=66713 RepID=A0AA88XWC1_PINIB|nr:hypothetical protein FSP39_000489 [Pinctada imbricata]